MPFNAFIRASPRVRSRTDHLTEWRTVKNQPFTKRLRYAIQGILLTFKTESSFRTQIVCAIAAILLLFLTRPPAIWWAIMFLTINGVLAAELINTALELVIDRLHPEEHPMIASAKDCAAGAVLIMSICSIGVGVALLINYWGKF